MKSKTQYILSVTHSIKMGPRLRVTDDETPPTVSSQVKAGIRLRYNKNDSKLLQSVLLTFASTDIKEPVL